MGRKAARINSTLGVSTCSIDFKNTDPEVIAARKLVAENTNILPERRRCLMCLKKFMSTGRGNRRCEKCSRLVITDATRVYSLPVDTMNGRRINKPIGAR